MWMGHRRPCMGPYAHRSMEIVSPSRTKSWWRVAIRRVLIPPRPIMHDGFAKSLGRSPGSIPARCRIPG